jgi:hypothetical protein
MTSRLASSRAKPPNRHGDSGDECPEHVLDVLTVDRAKPEPPSASSVAT